MKKRILKKLKSTCGESIGETLAAMIVIALAMTMLAGSIVSASKVNKQVKDYDTSFLTNSDTTTSGTVTLAFSSGSDTVNVSVKTTNPSSAKVHYIYYEKS